MASYQTILGLSQGQFDTIECGEFACDSANLVIGGWTFTFPTGLSGTIVSDNSTANLINKTIDGSLNTLRNVPANALVGVVPVANGGTGQNGFANGILVSTNNVISTVTQIPASNISGLGSMSLQNLDSVQIFGGNVKFLSNFSTVVGEIGELITANIRSISGTLSIADGGTTNVLNLATGTGVQTVNLGTGSGVTTINIGGSGDIVNVAGSLNYIQATDLKVDDKNIQLNAGAAGSGTARLAGLSIRDNNSDTQSYVRVTSAGTAFEIKAPENSYVLTTPVLAADATVMTTSDTLDVSTRATGILPIANGGTNASSASAARTSLGIGSLGTQAIPSAGYMKSTGAAVTSVTTIPYSDITGGPTSSQWTNNGSDIYFNTGSVGIGTSTPGRLLDLYVGGTGVTSYLRVSAGLNGSPSTSNKSILELYSQGGGGGTIITQLTQKYDGTDYGLFISNGTDDNLKVYNSTGNTVVRGSLTASALKLASMNNNRIMISSNGSIVEASALTNGQLLIGSTGAAPVGTTLTGSTNITVSNGAGSITLNTVQDLYTGASPTFQSLSLVQNFSISGGASGSFNVYANSSFRNAVNISNGSTGGAINIGGTDSTQIVNLGSTYNNYSVLAGQEVWLAVASAKTLHLCDTGAMGAVQCKVIMGTSHASSYVYSEAPLCASTVYGSISQPANTYRIYKASTVNQILLDYYDGSTTRTFLLGSW